MPHNKRAIIVGWSCVCDEEWYEYADPYTFIFEIDEMYEAVCRRVRVGLLPYRVRYFAESARDFANSVYEKNNLDDQRICGTVDVVTGRQLQALENFHRGLLRWFGWSADETARYREDQRRVFQEVGEDRAKLAAAGYAVGCEKLRSEKEKRQVMKERAAFMRRLERVGKGR